MNAETTPGAYPGNPSLPREVKEKILSTFRHTLNLFHEGKLDDCIIGCDFILKMDARFTPGRQLLEKARNPASAVDVAQLEAIVATTPTRQERVVAADPGRLLVRAVESFNARDFDAAIAAAQNVLEVLPGNQDAREILEKATRKKTSQPVFDASRGRALAALESNRKEDARVELEKMRGLDPDHPAVALLERRIAPAAPAAAPAPPRAHGTVAKAVPPPPPNFGGLDLDLPEETSSGGFGAETNEPEIQFDDNATVAMRIPSSMVSPPADGGAGGGLDSLSLDSLSLDMPPSSTAVAPPAVPSRGLTGPLQDSDAYSSAPAVSPGSPGDMWSDGGTGFGLEAEEPKAPVEPPVIHRAPVPPAAPMVDSLESVQEDFGAGEREIEGLLRQGDEAAARGDRQQAIEVWSRIFLIDINNTDAVVRIENAREQMAEGNRVISDGLKAGREKYEAGDLAGARELFLKVLAIDETEPTARFHLDRIEEDMARAAAPETEAPKPAADPVASATDAKPARAPRKAIRLPVQPKVLAMVAVFAAMFFFLIFRFPPRSTRFPSTPLFRSHPQSVDAQPLPAPVVRLDEHAERPAAAIVGDPPRRRPDAALELVADHPGPAADAALGDGARRGRGEGGQRILGRDVESINVVQAAVPRLADDRQGPGDRADWLGLDLGPDEGVVDDPDAVRVRQSDRAAEQAGLADPFQPGQLAVAVEPMRAGEHGFGPDVAVVGDDHGDPGPDGPAAADQGSLAPDERPMADPDPRHVGDRVPRAGSTEPDDDAEIACSHPSRVAVRRGPAPARRTSSPIIAG